MRNLVARGIISIFASHVSRSYSRRSETNKKAVEAGLRPINKDYPKTAQQAASYLQVSLNTFEVCCERLSLEPCETYQGWQGTVPLYDIEAMIVVYRFISETVSE